MIDWNLLLLLADDAAAEAAKEAPPGGGLGQMMILFLPIIVIWFVMFILPQNRERSRRQEMLNSLKKNDPVITIGGIFGTVSHISEDGKEVTIKIDDNARVKLRRDAISEVVRKDAGDTG